MHLVASLVLSLLFPSILLSNEVSRNNTEEIYDNYQPCSDIQFECFNGQCIRRSWWCDGTNDCGDNSDEIYCGYINETENEWVCHTYPYEFLFCKNGWRCYPSHWRCDGTVDCPDKSDEELCSNIIEIYGGHKLSYQKALKWVWDQRSNNSVIGKWGIEAPRIALMLYMGVEEIFLPGNRIGEEISHEITIRVLAALLRRETASIPFNQLAIYINALMAICKDPRSFYGMDLVALLRNCVNNQTEMTNPYLLLTLCNAEDKITENDVNKLLDLLQPRKDPFWTDIQALSMLALTCISHQDRNFLFLNSDIRQLAWRLKQTQQADGSFETLQTTALVMQALIGSGEDALKNWNYKGAVEFLSKNQQPDGSFAHFLNTYYIFPVLKHKSLINISMAHCNPDAIVDSVSDELHKKLRDKARIHYSIILENEIDITRTVTLRVPLNIAFFEAMKLAAVVDSTYRFKYKKLNSKPYVYMLLNIYNDPEQGKFWKLYKADNSTMMTMLASPVDIVVEDEDKFIMWYRHDHWIPLKELPDVDGNYTFHERLNPY